MVASDVVVTAAHNLYMPRYGGRFRSASLFQARSGSSLTLGTRIAAQELISNRWRLVGDFNCDWAAVRMDIPAHNSHQVFNISVRTNASLMNANTPVTLVGYPGVENDPMAT